MEPPSLAVDRLVSLLVSVHDYHQIHITHLHQPQRHLVACPSHTGLHPPWEISTKEKEILLSTRGI